LHTGHTNQDHTFEIEIVHPRYVFIPTPLSSAEHLNLDAYAKDHRRGKDFNPDMLTVEGTSTG
jgi:hypothetical protein